MCEQASNDCQISKTTGEGMNGLEADCTFQNLRINVQKNGWGKKYGCALAEQSALDEKLLQLHSAFM